MSDTLAPPARPAAGPPRPATGQPPAAGGQGLLPPLTRVPSHPPARHQIEVLRRLLRNPMEGWPQTIYAQDFVRRRLLNRIDTVFITGPDMVREVLLDHVDAFQRSTTLPRAGLKPMLREGLLTTEGTEWRWQRRTAAPVFRRESLSGFVPAMQDAAAQTAARLAGHAGAEVNMAHEMMRTTFDIILQTMLSGGQGIDAARVEAGVNDLLGSVNWGGVLAMLGAPGWLPYPGRRRSERSRDMLRGMVAQAIAARHGAAATGAGDLLAHLAQAQDPETGRPMPHDQVVDNVLTFILAGHETTALALTWALYLLAFHPQAAGRIRAETQEVTGGGPVTAGNIDALDYTRRVVMESMRLYPPAAVISRLARQDLRIGGHDIRAGSFVIIPIYAIHRHQALWEQPDVFDPERFTAAQVAARHRYAYLPFAAGQHICIGMNFAIMEAVVILANLLRDLRFDLRPGFDPGLRLRITMRPARGMPMRPERI